MSKLSDQKYLLTEQYKNASNLNARFQLHERFSINRYGWHQWVFDQLHPPPSCRILELGCGPGYLWLKNNDRIPDGWDITLSDFSPGMLQEAQQNLSPSDHPFTFEVIDAQSIPFPDESFDAVIANHMLYHVTDRNKAFSEICRVLKPGGCLYAATNGRNHLRELGELVRRFDPNFSPDDRSSVGSSENFSLEHGMVQLSRWFSNVTLRRYEDALVITEAEPVIAYVLSSARFVPVDNLLPDFVSFIEQELAPHGVIRITKDSGIFEAHRDNSM